MKNLLTLRNTRRVAQVFFFTLFLFFVFVTDLRYLKGYPVSLFLELDPLVAFATAITTHTVYMGLLWSLLLILPTLLFGRIFCNWICPYGILHHFTGWLLGKRRAEERERIAVSLNHLFRAPGPVETRSDQCPPARADGLEIGDGRLEQRA